MNTRPEASEHSPFHANYIALVPGGDIVAATEEQGRSAVAFLEAIPEEMGSHRYAPGKWTIKEVIGHVIDTERIQAYRALRIARNDQTNLPGFEQDDYIPYSNANGRSIADLVSEFAAVRHASVLLLKSFDAAAWTRRGTANNSSVTVRALAYILTGHELNHRRTLKERYLTTAAGL